MLAATGAPAEVGVLPEGCELDGCDEDLEEQALSETTAATSAATSVGPTPNRARATLPIDSIPSSAS
jgi:hypothetical protein